MIHFINSKKGETKMKTGKRKLFAIFLTMAMVVTTVEGVSKKDIIGRAATEYFSNKIEVPDSDKSERNVAFDSSTIVHDGKDGDISWAIDNNGCLKLEGNGDWKGLADSFVIVGGAGCPPKWLDYAQDIISAKVEITGITNCKYMFDGCSKLSYVDMQNFDTSDVTDMSYMFRYCEQLQKLDLSGVDTSNVEGMAAMFEGCNMLQSCDLRSFDTSNVVYMDGMFRGCESLQEINITSFETSKLKYMYDMFKGCKSLKKLDLSSFDLSNLVHNGWDNSFGSFDDLDSLSEIRTPINLPNKIHYDEDSDSSNDSRLPYRAAAWKDDNGKVYKEFPFETEQSIVLSCDSASLESVPLNGTSGQIKWEIDEQGKLTLEGNGECKDEDYPEWHKVKANIKSCVVNVTGITDASNMFADLPYLEKIIFENFDTSKMKSMRGMFRNDVSLTSLDVSDFDTSNVTDMMFTFADCVSLKTIDLTQFRTEKVESFAGMFKGCRQLARLDLRNMNTVQSDDFCDMFSGCSNLKHLQLNNFHTEKKNIEGELYLYRIFQCCHNLTNLDISGWNLENVPQDTRYNFETGSSEPDSWPSFLGGAVSLSQIRTPIHLKVEVALPEGNWTDESGKQYTNLPMNLSESILLKNTEKPQYEWEDLGPLPTLRPTQPPQKTASPTPTQKPTPVVSSLPDHTPSPSVTPSGTEVKKAAIKSVKNKKGKKAVIRWKKVKGASGYQIAYAVNKKFKKKKTKSVTKTTVTLKKLKKKKTYYIKVRAYKKIKGEKVYGKWSNVKKVKIKK